MWDHIFSQIRPSEIQQAIQEVKKSDVFDDETQSKLSASTLDV